jgi:hypothetical protein
LDVIKRNRATFAWRGPYLHVFFHHHFLLHHAMMHLMLHHAVVMHHFGIRIHAHRLLIVHCADAVPAPTAESVAAQIATARKFLMISSCEKKGTRGEPFSRNVVPQTVL